MTSKTFYSVIFLLCLGLNLFGQSLQYENQIVEKVSVEMVNLEGNAFDACTIIARMKTHEGSFFSQIDFDNDLKTLVQEYDRVEPQVSSVDDKLYITLKIWPRPTIRSISWNGNEKIASKQLQKELGISLCAVFDRQEFNKAFHKLKGYYVKQGYFEASLDYTINLDPLTNTVDIDICIQEGRAGRIRQICFIDFAPDEREALLEKMLTKKYFTLFSWYTDEGTYNEEMMQHDRFTILTFLQNEGYADATVDVSICEAPKRNRIDIIITGHRGDVYYFEPSLSVEISSMTMKRFKVKFASLKATPFHRMPSATPCAI